MTPRCATCGHFMPWKNSRVERIFDNSAGCDDVETGECDACLEERGDALGAAWQESAGGVAAALEYKHLQGGF